MSDLPTTYVITRLPIDLTPWAVLKVVLTEEGDDPCYDYYVPVSYHEDQAEAIEVWRALREFDEAAKRLAAKDSSRSAVEGSPARRGDHRGG